MTTSEPSKSEGVYRHFAFRFIPDTPVAKAMKYALIHPVMSPHSADFLFEDVTVKTALRQVQQSWRDQVSGLQRVKWSDVVNPIGWRVGINCPPMFSLCKKPAPRPCHKYLICPFCWSRQVVSETFFRLEYDLYGTTRSTRLTASDELSAEVEPLPLDIVELIRTDITGFDHTAEELTDLAYQSRADFRDKFVNMRGALSLSTLEPLTDSWKLTRRLLIVISKDYPDSEIPEETDHLYVRRHNEEMTKDKLAGIVGRVCAYPAGMLSGDAVRVREVLDARRGNKLNVNNNARGTSKRLMSFYGKLRNKQDRAALYSLDQATS